MNHGRGLSSPVKKTLRIAPFHIKTPVWVLILASKSKPTKKDRVALEERLGGDAPTSFASQSIIGAVQFIDSVEQFDSKWYDGGIAWVVGDYVELPTPIENVPGALTPMLYVDKHPLRERIFKELGI